MVGALLLQPNRDTEDPINDPPEFWWIVQVIQKQLNRYQQRWAVIVKELFSVVTGIGEFRETMQLCKQRFILSDHQPLKHLARSRLWGKLSPVQQRLMTVILSLHAKWLYCPGPKSQISDVTSRWRLIHKPEGSQLIPVPMRTGEVLQPGNGLTAPLMDRIDLGETLHPVRQERKDEMIKIRQWSEEEKTAYWLAKHGDREHHSYSFMLGEYSCELRQETAAQAFVSPGLLDVMGRPVVPLNEELDNVDGAIDLVASMARTSAEDPVTQIVLALVDDLPIDPKYDADTVRIAQRTYEKYKDNWRVGGRATGSLSLYFQGRNDFFPRHWLARPLRKSWWRMHHGAHNQAHPGAEQTYRNLSRVVMWDDVIDARSFNDPHPSMKKDVFDWCGACFGCQTGKPYGTTLDHRLGESLTGIFPFDVCQIDVIILEKTARGMTCVICFTDVNTRFRIGTAAKDHTAKTLAWFLLYLVALIFGCPRICVTDLGREVNNQVFSELCRLLGILRHSTAPYDAHGVAHEERIHREIESAFRTLSVGNDWDLVVPAIIFALNTRYNRMIKSSPFMALFGRDPLFPQDAILVGLAAKELQLDEDEFKLPTAKWADRLVNGAKSRATLELARQIAAAEKWDQRRGKGPHMQPVKIGDEVLVKATPSKKAFTGAATSPLWLGPFKVTELSPNKLRITAEYVPDTAIVVVRHAQEWRRFLRDEDDTDDVLLTNNKYEVEDIIGARGPREDREYLARWRWFPAEFDSWEPKESFVPVASWRERIEAADLQWPPAEELELAREPMPGPTETAPSWLLSLGPDDIEKFDGLVQGKVLKLRFTLKNKGSSKRRGQSLTRLVAVNVLPPAIRDCAEVQHLLHQG